MRILTILIIFCLYNPNFCLAEINALRSEIILGKPNPKEATKGKRQRKKQRKHRQKRPQKTQNIFVLTIVFVIVLSVIGLGLLLWGLLAGVRWLWILGLCIGVPGWLGLLVFMVFSIGIAAAPKVEPNPY